MKNIGHKIVEKSLDHPKLITIFFVLITLFLAFFISGIKDQIDTDPENMLSKKEAVRIFHEEMKKELSLHDIVVVGVVDEKNSDGVFNTKTLSNIFVLTEFAKSLSWQDDKNPSNYEGVVSVDLMAPSVVDNIEQGNQLGEIKFEWLMPRPPQTKAEALAVRDKALRLPFMNGTLVSEDGKAVAIYIPLTKKSLSYRVASALKKKISQFDGTEKYYITGLPVAEDTFGVEMFKQMAISAPLAMLIIFILMLYFFRKLSLIISPMIVAMMSVLATMGLLIGLGYTVHIMSSMIPIFIMPIAVLDSIHILSEFFDRYQQTKDRRSTVINVMDELFMPMLYTSLTSAAGFASLALAPIPPVQVFGCFVAFGIMFAWILTVTFIPAYIMFIPQKSLEKFGAKSDDELETAPMTRVLRKLGRLTFNYAKLIIILTVILAGVAYYGINKIQINDNPTKWFSKKHPIRIADKVFNEHFAGTYMAYLAIEPAATNFNRQFLLNEFKEFAADETKKLEQDDFPAAKNVFKKLISKADSLKKINSETQLLTEILNYANALAKEKNDGQFNDALEEITYALEAKIQEANEIFKQPRVLNYIDKLQAHIVSDSKVGKANSIVDIVKTVYRELLGGKQEFYKIPDTSPKVAETLFQYQNSHRPYDLWHFVTPDYRKASVWFQLKSGDNKEMGRIARETAEYIKKNPPPIPLEAKWFGLTYINVVWQDKMVTGMLQAFLGSFLIVFFMMIVLFRSALWGLLAMIPLTVTIGLIYGTVGFIGKDYDMPIAVLSSLTLGLAVDFAIHFLARTRKIVAEKGSWENAVEDVFGEPARAITRNVIVIAVGFLPLLAAPLIPYKTVGVFLATILAVSGVGTLFILPALITVLNKKLFESDNTTFMCKCKTCTIAGITLVALVAVNIHQFLSIGWSKLSWVSLISIIIITIICLISGHRKKCN